MNDAQFSAAGGGPIRAWTRFWFTPADPLGLHIIRICAGLLFLSWLLPLAGQQEAFFSLDGWFDRQAYSEAARLPEGPPKPLSWSALYLFGSNVSLLKIAFWLSIGAIALFTCGIAVRATAILAWVAIASYTASPVLETDADPLLLILSFYLMIGYVFFRQRDTSLSLVNRVVGGRDCWLWGQFTRNDDDRPSLAANLTLRLLQVHFAIVICTNGLHKLQFGDWWAGVAFWFPLHPAFTTTLDQARAHVADGIDYLTVLSLGAYAVLFWQIAFPLYAWRKGWRVILIGGAVIAWLGSALMYENPLFGPAVLIGCLSFLEVEEWRWLLAVAAAIPGVNRLVAPSAQEPARLQPTGAKKNVPATSAAGRH